MPNAISQTNSKTSSSDDEELETAEARQGYGRHGEPDCPFCGGAGFVMPDVPPGDTRFGRATPCTCRLRREDVQRRSKLLALSQLGLLQECTFENFMADGVGLTPAKQRNLRFVYDQVRAYAENPQGWLILRGGYGAGKTHLAAAVGNSQLAKGQPALFVNMPDLLDYLRAAFSPSSEQGYDQRFEEIRSTPLLILDDFGAQNNTDWVQEKLYQIFNYRYTAQLPTVVTTNEELEAIDARIRSRLVDPSLSQIVTLLAPDYRQAGGQQEQSDLSTLGLHMDKSFESFDLRDHELPRAESNNLRRAFELAQNFATSPEGWLVFNGVYGNGKTHLAAAIANAVARQGESVLFIVVPDLLDHLRAAFNPTSGTSYDKRFAEVKATPLLVLDDLGTESATPWAREKLYQLFNYRYNARLPTVITTAVPPDELDPRLASRMLDGDRCTFFVLEAPSYRGGGKTGRKPRGRK
ncbi:MAG: ATP-binding protein [Chloroflexi bacterium]|nr:ATP-binding protein [Chloroflexota bacterium]